MTLQMAMEVNEELQKYHSLVLFEITMITYCLSYFFTLSVPRAKGPIKAVSCLSNNEGPLQLGCYAWKYIFLNTGNSNFKKRERGERFFLAS